METKDLETRLSHVEIKYKTDTVSLKEQLEYEKIRFSELQKEMNSV